MAKTTKKHRAGKIVLIVLCVFAALIAGLAAANAICARMVKRYAQQVEPVAIENQLKPEIDYTNGFYTFTTDREFKIMQLTDIHLGAGILSVASDKQVMQTVETMIRTEKPDLVIVTGDAFFPVPQSGTLNNAAELDVFCTLMNRLGVYWAFTFGNHEYQGPCFLKQEALSERLEACGEYCLYQRGPVNLSGEGNYVINVKNSDGVITRSLILLDSHAYVPEDAWGLDGTYECIQEDQVLWYKQTVQSLTEENKQTIMSLPEGEKKSTYSEQLRIPPSLLFLHIPLKEYRIAWENYKNNGYRDTADTVYVYGQMGETEAPYIFCSEKDDALFESAIELGSTQGIFCGHDHTNTFAFDYCGIRLSYGMSCDCLVYKNIRHLGAQRGCTMIVCAPDGSFTSTPENYYQPKYDFEGKEIVTMQVLNEAMEKQ